MFLKRIQRLGIKIKHSMSVLFKDTQDMGLKKRHFNYSSNITLLSLTHKYILLMEYLILIRSYKNSLNK
jgi:hypothetical protein